MMRRFRVYTTWGRALSTWAETQEAAERRIAADLLRAGEGEEVYFSSDAERVLSPRERRS